MSIRLAVLVSHPIQHFAPWHREIAKLSGVDLRVFFYCDWGTENYLDTEFQTEVKWDIPLLDGYEHEFLPIASRPKQINFWQVDNPKVGDALDRFAPDVVKVFGYALRTNWRVASWAKRRRKPLMLYSDSNAKAPSGRWKRLVKQTVVGRFYSYVDGALFVGDNNLAYHKQYGLPDERLFPGALPIDQNQLFKNIKDRDLIRKTVRERLGIPHDAFVVMFCGKYSERKRPLDLVASAHLSSQQGLPTWSLLVGEGSERSIIEEFCRINNVNNTTLTGFVNQNSIPEYYVASDALAMTSSQDPHPLVVSEAAAFGLPAIVSDKIGCIGPHDTARPGVNAIVYPCGDRERLQAAIESLYHHHDLYQRMSAAAIEVSKEQDVTVAAERLTTAALQLHSLGPR